MSDETIMGRPPLFNPEIGEIICQRIASGESLRGICESPGYPDRVTVFRWLRLGASGQASSEIQNFCHQYREARDDQAEAFADECIQIADDASDDILFAAQQDAEGDGARPLINHSVINRAKLRIETRKWAASVMKPKKFASTNKTELTGANGGPIETKNISEAEAEKRLAELLKKAGLHDTSPTSA